MLARVVALALSMVAAGACAHIPPMGRPPSSCGDPCAVLNCPQGTRCDVTQSCAASCQPEPMPQRFP